MTATPNFLDVHILHAVPYSNLNRDNLGTPKQMIYGGTARARISSQCTKRAARLWLESNTDLGEALRTRRLPQSLREELTESHGLEDEDACEAVGQLFKLANIKVSETPAGELQGDQLTFTTSEAARRLAHGVAAHREAILGEDFKPTKSVKDALLEPLRAKNAVIALCGRMLAESSAGVNVDGALQVAHAFTTHASTVEQDYFTAVDDVVQSDDEETGAGHINVNEFTSGVFYRCATIGLESLRKSLDGSEATVAEAASSFLRAFTLSEPTGKQNAANAHTRPALVAAVLRSDRPASFAAAFESPVSAARGGGHMTESIARLASHAAAEKAFYGDAGQTGAWCTVMASVAPDATLDSLGEPCTSLSDLTSAVETALDGAAP
ncbi:MAG: type I-E CRISPR-associated protein Cas7/Cse4/CasC [Synechococcus sp. SB0672_bin_6]|nr:type I-E CRISPR-associated protein Cas7/Cse4/CasC [Synechococcus sp. SB0672_bin_6]